MRVRQYVYFSLTSQALTAAEITGRLLFEPDAFLVKGSHDQVRRLPREHHWQILASPDNRPVDEQVTGVVERLAPLVSGIGALVAEGQVKSTLWVVRHFDDEEGVEDEGTPPDLAALGMGKLQGQHHLLGWRLDRTALNFLQRTGAELDVDEYG